LLTRVAYAASSGAEVENGSVVLDVH